MKKGQQATEFLTTYGITIIAILLVTGVLAYFGYLNPGQFTPNSCTTGKQLSCEDFLVTENHIYLTIKNNLQETIIIENIESNKYQITDCSLPTIISGTIQEIECGINAIERERAEFDIGIKFKQLTGPTHTIKGTISTQVRNNEVIQASCPDNDNDGFRSAICGGNDCNDGDSNINPGATDYCSGGVDEDCDGDDTITEQGCLSCDADGDGFSSTQCAGNDCDDGNPRIYPFNGLNNFCDCTKTGDGIAKGAPEENYGYDGKDNDCDGLIDEGQEITEDCSTPGDQDGDGCDDTRDTDCGYQETGSMCWEPEDEDCDGYKNCQDSSCESAYKNLCLQCENNILDGAESDIDCGGVCLPCLGGQKCNDDNDCKNNDCSSAGVCVSCTDGIQNQDETDIDCGGSICAQCGPTSNCNENSDCQTNNCCPNGQCSLTNQICLGEPPIGP